MGNTVFINNDNIIEIILQGELSEASLTVEVEKAYKYADELRSKNLPVLIITDITGVTKITEDARKYLLSNKIEMKPSKNALVGKEGVIKNLFNFLNLVRRDNTIKFCSTRQEAEKWLNRR